MRLKRSEVIEVHQNISKVLGLKGVKLSYAIVKSLKRISEEVGYLERCRNAIVVSPEYIEYDKRRVELCKQFCKKDSDGTPIEKNGVFDGLDNNAEFIKALEALNMEHKVALDGRKAQFEEFNELLKSKVDIEIHQVSMEDIPADVTVEQMVVLSMFIKE